MKTKADVIVQTVFAAKGLTTTNTFSFTATDMGLLRGLSLTASTAPLTLTLMLFVPVTGVICYCMVALGSTCTSIVSSSLHFINRTKRFKKQVDEDSVWYHLIDTT